MSSSEVRGSGYGGSYGDQRRATRLAIAGERERETRGRVSEDERGTWGSRGIPGRLQDVGKSRRWPACGRGRRPRAPRPPGGRRTTTGKASQLGRARWARPAQVRPRWVSLSLFLICFLFYFFLQLLGFIKNTKTFSKILKIIVGLFGLYLTVLA